ncbi:DUF3043 domain-containing protein [Mycolicibacterium komossense]|uniref:DUF3043 domain-containing protein n=1 Tax=Mycolicibacterium komossense TaxID=1779 RepID=UPI0021F393E5|nr:DUF3043 domain-containing protein [Mycolicibacterium komossense]
MKLLGRKKDGDENAAGSAEPTGAEATDGTDGVSTKTAPKGRPTPKRSESARKRGPVAPAPMTSAEARARRKAVAGPKLSREEKKIERNERRASMNERRERMMAGEEAYLLPRDQGPLRRYVRDIVDARRNLLGLFMPFALLLIFVMLGVPQVQLFVSPAMLILMGLMAVDGILLARKVGNAVDVKFPNNTESRLKLGLYAAGRASQIRRMRAPKPQVNRGDTVIA